MPVKVQLFPVPSFPDGEWDFWICRTHSYKHLFTTQTKDIWPGVIKAGSMWSFFALFLWWLALCMSELCRWYVTLVWKSDCTCSMKSFKDFVSNLHQCLLILGGLISENLKEAICGATHSETLTFVQESPSSKKTTSWLPCNFHDVIWYEKTYQYIDSEEKDIKGNQRCLPSSDSLEM